MYRLTPREIEVLEHLSEGESNRKIALDLFISQDTLKTHIKGIYRKVGIPLWANSRAWIAVHAGEVLEGDY